MKTEWDNVLGFFYKPRVTRPGKNYAQDALKEVLGWYGLQEGAEGGPAALQGPGTSRPPPDLRTPKPPPPTSDRPSSLHPTSIDEVSQPSIQDANMVVKPVYAHTGPPTSLGPISLVATPDDNNTDDPLDLTNGHGSVTNMANANGSSIKTNWTGHRKLIGMRFLFPPLSDDMPLMDRAKIWVRRHDYKYFVGWSEAQLQDIDPILRPIGSITAEKYKLHMNRSEYCRNVKLKYCLESDTEWAQQFRTKLSKTAADGGFTGLCQAKIAAAELWRKYSENYRSHQARYPNPKSKHRTGHGSHDPGNESDTSSKRKSSAEESIDLEDDGSDDSQEAKRRHLEDEYDAMYDDDDMNVDPSKIHYESDECHEMGDLEHCREAAYKEEHREGAVSSPGELDPVLPTPKPSVASPKERPVCDEVLKPKMEEPLTPSEPSPSGGSPMILSPEQLTGRTFFPPLPGGAPYLGMPLPLYPGGHFALGLRGDAPFPMELKLNPSTSESMSSSAMSFVKPKHSERHHHEYKRSERGLSYLFPSLSDHNLSLMDKVRITVIRHKNNYFLGKSDADLNKIDPLIRPKMIVTTEIYKEYCHRNAMKYDSNLQFAMESPEPWAHEFRAKLMRPPSEGGFSSLCEVKLEAGRLWREFSGKYRMHNIVKWQMDLNNASKGPKSEGDGSESRQRESQSSQEGICPSPISPSEHSDIDPRATPISSKFLSPQSSTESMELYPMSSRAVCNVDPPRPGATTSSSPKTVLPEGPGRGGSGHAGALDLHLEPHPRLGSDSSSGSSTSRKLRGHITARAQAQHLETIYSHSKSVPHLTTEVPGTPEPIPTRASPQEPPRPKVQDLALPDALFKPLPRSLTVAEQLSVWLERHRHNYFLGFPKEDLIHLNELLRPTMIVTEETFKKFIPESMVDILSKIELIMLSTDSWAIDFQDRVHKPSKDGGFSTFEDALTEAVMLWNIARSSYHHQLLRDPRSSLAARPEHIDTFGEASISSLDMPGMTPHLIKTEGSPRLPPLPSQPATSYRYPFEAQLPVNPRFIGIPRPKSLDRPVPESPSPQVTQTSSAEEKSHPPKVDEPREAPGPRDLKAARPPLPPVDVTSILWALRDKLQAVCRDDPDRSWLDRLQPHMSTLKASLGSSYVPPQAHSDCLLDLVLATIHENMHHITGGPLTQQHQDALLHEHVPETTTSTS